MISLIKVPSQDGNRTNYVVEKWNSRLNALPASSSQNLSYSDEEEVLSIQEGNVDGFQKLNDLSHAVNDKKKAWYALMVVYLMEHISKGKKRLSKLAIVLS